MTSGRGQKEADTEVGENEVAYCTNCDERLMGQFCYACGQKNIGPRLNGRLLIHSLFEAISNVDSRLWYTLIALVKNPGHVAKAYIGGARAKYINPVQFFLATFAVYIAFLASVGWLQSGSLEAINVTFDDAPSELPEAEAMIQSFLASIKSVLTEQRDLFTFITLPIFALLLKWVFRTDQRNFAETLSFVCFMFGMIQIYGLGIGVFQYILAIPYNGSQGWVVFAVLIQSIYGFYSGGWIKSTLMGVLAFLMLSLVQTFAGASLAAIHMFLT